MAKAPTPPPAAVRRALVTGGSGGIGEAVCRRLAADGRHVIIHAHRNLAAAERLAAELGAPARALAFDLTDRAATHAALEALLEEGPIHILVNNAGVHDDAVFPGMREEQWHRVIDVSVDGFFNVTQPLTLPMARERWGRIVNLSSVSALVGNRGQVNYAAAKGALLSATRALATELASRGITVNAVAPGIIDTPMSRGSFDSKAIEALVPMKRAGTPAEVAELVAFLASDRASYITGQVIAIHGGMF